MKMKLLQTLLSILTISTIICGISGCKREGSIPSQRAPQKTIDVQPTQGTPDSRRVLLVINNKNPDSIEIGEYYAMKRQIPPENICQIACGDAESITKTFYRTTIEDPIRFAIKNCPNEIDFIVLTKGVPIRIGDNFGPSVDSYVAAMNLAFEPLPSTRPPESDSEILRSGNPYYSSTERFTSKKFGFHLTTRLDGYTVEHVKRLIDRSVKAAPEQGTFYFDLAQNRTSGAYGALNAEMKLSATSLKERGFETLVETTASFVNPNIPLMGYVSWGSNDAKFDRATFKSLKFKSGAISETFVSTSARSFMELTDGQSQIGDLIAAGVTGVKGYASEPWTVALANPEILMDRYTRGYNLAESFYAASRLLKWKDVIIGDPICSPYAKKESGVRVEGK